MVIELYIISFYLWLLFYSIKNSDVFFEGAISIFSPNEEILAKKFARHAWDIVSPLSARKWYSVFITGLSYFQINWIFEVVGYINKVIQILIHISEWQKTALSRMRQGVQHTWFITLKLSISWQSTIWVTIDDGVITHDNSSSLFL